MKKTLVVIIGLLFLSLRIIAQTPPSQSQDSIVIKRYNQLCELVKTKDASIVNSHLSIDAIVSGFTGPMAPLILSAAAEQLPEDLTFEIIDIVKMEKLTKVYLNIQSELFENDENKKGFFIINEKNKFTEIHLFDANLN